MYIKKGKPREKNYSRIMRDYYVYECLDKNKSVLYEKSLDRISNNDLSNALLCLIDKDYLEARCKLMDLTSSYTNEFYGLYAENDVLIAHGNVIYSFNDEGEIQAFLDNIYIHRIEDFLESPNRDHIKWIYGIYSILLEFIENSISEYAYKIKSLEYTTKQPTSELYSVLEQSGYQKKEDTIDPNNIKFCKQLREKGVSRARSNFSKQTD